MMRWIVGDTKEGEVVLLIGGMVDGLGGGGLFREVRVYFSRDSLWLVCGFFLSREHDDFGAFSIAAAREVSPHRHQLSL